jgi:hypothetical protein
MASSAIYIPAGKRAAPPARAARLERRGVRHGWVLDGARPAPVDARLRAEAAAALASWPQAKAILLPGAIAARLQRHASDVRATLALFERLRRGASFQDALWARLAHDARFEPAGATRDLGDAREIEKVFADARERGRITARDLYAKLSWISHDERDVSLRIRFSFGAEQLFDWQGEARRAPWSDRLADGSFPECAVLTGQRALVALIEKACGRRVRFSERIVYNNAPGGGAVFHCDVEPFQLGVLYGQLAGETGWLALPKRELAEEVEAFARASSSRALARKARRALRWLDHEDDRELGRLLNHTPRFTERLVERGAFFRLRAGDALLLPSPGPDDACWHSVFALGRRPSLAHSYGIFGLRRSKGERSAARAG